MDIKDTYTRVFLQAADQECTADNIKKHKGIWWYNFRQKNQGGLRLTEQGMNFVEEDAKIKTYKIEFPKEFAFTAQTLIWLDNFIDSPYFITKKYIIVLKEKAAFELYLFSGDIRKLGYNKALAKRLTQDSVHE